MSLKPQDRKYGVYTVDNQEFLFKKDAFDYAKHDKYKIKYSMLGIKELDISQDPFPNLSILDLYRIRAQEIRDSYDYLVLNLSGGPDSMNILNVFVKNNIPLDEIVNHNSYDQTSVVTGSGNNADYIYNVKPRLKELEKIPGFKTKITIVNEIESVQSRLNDIYRIGNDNILCEAGGPNRPTSVGGQSIQYIDHLWKMIRDGQNIGVISGVDKPECRIFNNQKMLLYTDNLRGQFVEFITKYQINPFWEWFYQGDFRITHKQCYLLQQFVKHHTEIEFYEKFDHQKNRPVRSAQHWPSWDKKLNLKYSPFHTIIYPDLEQTVVTPKDANIWLKPQDNWWFQKIDEKLKNLYTKSIFNWKQQFAIEGTGLPFFAEKILLK